jgi:hypothetical protein
MLGNLGRADLDLRMRTDCVRNLLIGVASLTQALDLVTNHANKGAYREQLRRKSSLVTERLLGAECFFNGVLSASLLCHICRAPLFRSTKNEE